MFESACVTLKCDVVDAWIGERTTEGTAVGLIVWLANGVDVEATGEADGVVVLGYNNGINVVDFAGLVEGDELEETVGILLEHTLGFIVGKRLEQDEGTVVGDILGFTVGFALGYAEGFADGATLEVKYGLLDGTALGHTIGPNEGTTLRIVLGYDEGASEGDLTSDLELGAWVTANEGALEGNEDCEFTGIMVGLTIRAADGFSVEVVIGLPDGNCDIGVVLGKTDGCVKGFIDGGFE